MKRKSKNLKASDPEIAELIAAEAKRQNETIDLIASENIVSQAVLEALGSKLTNKYSEGYSGRRYYAGNAVIDEVEQLAIERAKKVFGLGDGWHVNVQALSGSPANMAAYFALLEPGDTIMAMGLAFGGHLTHGSPVNFSGKLFNIVPYSVTKEGLIDYTEIKKLAKEKKPKLIVAGATAYSRIIDFEKFGKIACEVGAYLMVDMAHIAGLVAAGVHPSPFAHADIVTTTTHKTLRGPRGALIFSKVYSAVARQYDVDIPSAVDKMVFPGLQGGPHDNQTAAIAVALGEAMRPEFKKYGKQIVINCKALAVALQKHGIDLVSGGTDNHLILIDLTDLGFTGKKAQEALEGVCIITNRNSIPYDTRSPFNPSGLRIGTASVTTRGMGVREMREIASMIHEALTTGTTRTLRSKVLSLCKRFSL